MMSIANNLLTRIDTPLISEGGFENPFGLSHISQLCSREAYQVITDQEGHPLHAYRINEEGIVKVWQIAKNIFISLALPIVTITSLFFLGKHIDWIALHAIQLCRNYEALQLILYLLATYELTLVILITFFITANTFINIIDSIRNGINIETFPEMFELYISTLAPIISMSITFQFISSLIFFLKNTVLIPLSLLTMFNNENSARRELLQFIETEQNSNDSFIINKGCITRRPIPLELSPEDRINMQNPDVHPIQLLSLWENVGKNSENFGVLTRLLNFRLTNLSTSDSRRMNFLIINLLKSDKETQLRVLESMIGNRTTYMNPYSAYLDSSSALLDRANSAMSALTHQDFENITEIHFLQLLSLWCEITPQPHSDTEKLRRWLSKVGQSKNFSVIRAEDAPIVAAEAKEKLTFISAMLQRKEIEGGFNDLTKVQIIQKLIDGSTYCGPRQIDDVREAFAMVKKANTLEEKLLNHLQYIKEEILQECIIHLFPGRDVHTTQYLNRIRLDMGEELGLNTARAELDGAIAGRLTEEKKQKIRTFFYRKFSPSGIVNALKERINLKETGGRWGNCTHFLEFVLKNSSTLQTMANEMEEEIDTDGWTAFAYENCFDKTTVEEFDNNNQLKQTDFYSVKPAFIKHLLKDVNFIE